MKLILSLLVFSVVLFLFSGSGTVHGEILYSGPCNNSQDLAIFKADNFTFANISNTCGHNCLGAAQCSANCINKQTGLSIACADCFGTYIACGKQDCLKQCLVNPQSQACLDCLNANCSPALLQCVGVPRNDLPQQ